MDRGLLRGGLFCVSVAWKKGCISVMGRLVIIQPIAGSTPVYYFPGLKMFC